MDQVLRGAMKFGSLPMRHLVRHVFPDGSSIITQMVWQRPYPGLDVITRFHDEDTLNGRLDRQARATKAGSRRSRFENRYKLSRSNEPGSK